MGSELAVLKTKLNVEIRNKQLQKQNELQLKSIEENISRVAKNVALKEQKRAMEGNPFGQFFMPHYYDKISLERAAAVLTRENAEKRDGFFQPSKEVWKRYRFNQSRSCGERKSSSGK